VAGGSDNTADNNADVAQQAETTHATDDEVMTGELWVSGVHTDLFNPGRRSGLQP
jgi:hypothetical protein